MCDRIGCNLPKLDKNRIIYFNTTAVFCDKCMIEWRKVYERLIVGTSLSEALRKFVDESEVWSVS